jgi:pSer/pThr/pTyr-binding forkhead associated (FHA) protein
MLLHAEHCCGACEYGAKVARGEILPVQRDQRLAFEIDGNGVPVGAVLRAKRSGDAFPIVKAESVIGRARDCDIVIPSQTVSRRTAILSFAGGGANIRDLDSACGVWVNCHKIREHVLFTGDEIIVGDEVLIVEHAR